MKLIVHTAVGASFRMEKAAVSTRLGSYLFARFQQMQKILGLHAILSPFWLCYGWKGGLLLL